MVNAIVLLLFCPGGVLPHGPGNYSLDTHGIFTGDFLADVDRLHYGYDDA